MVRIHFHTSLNPLNIELVYAILNKLFEKNFRIGGERMILETIDWVILIILFIGLSVVFYVTVEKKVHIKYTFFLGTVLIGAFMLWGTIRFDVTMLPSWIQAGATLMLLLVTGMSTYAAVIMAEGNRELVQATNKQVSMLEREQKRPLIIEIARDVIQKILSLLHDEMRGMKSGHIIFRYFKERDEGQEEIFHYPIEHSPETILRSKIFIPDKIMRNYCDQIKKLNIRFADHNENINLYLSQLYLKETKKINEFRTFCATLKDFDNISYGNFEIEMIFAMAIADAKDRDFSGYRFFDPNRDKIIKKIIELGLQNDINDYKKIQEGLNELINDYEKVFFQLFGEWKEEYNLTDKDLQK